MFLNLACEQKLFSMENWIGAYRLPPNLGLGVQERGVEGGPGEAGGPGGGTPPRNVKSTLKVRSCDA